MCLCWLDTQRRKKAIQVSIVMSLSVNKNSQNYIMPTNLTQNYKVYPRFQQNVTKTSSKSLELTSERKGNTPTLEHTKVIL